MSRFFIEITSYPDIDLQRYFDPYQPLLLLKTFSVNYFCEKQHLTCLTGICLPLKIVLQMWSKTLKIPAKGFKTNSLFFKPCRYVFSGP